MLILNSELIRRGARCQGGTLEREYAIGNGRMDLCLKYKKVTLGIEIKTWADKVKDPEEKGLDQLETYLARIKADYGWLCIFDRLKKGNTSSTVI